MKKAVLLTVCLLLLGTVPASSLEVRATGGMSMGIPFWLSADLGVVLGGGSEDTFTGVKLSGEAGIGGTKAFFGYYTATRQRFSSSSFAVGPALMRTFGSPLLADDWRTYVGVEAQLSVLAFMPVTLRLGVYSWIEEFHPQITFGFGFGL